MALKVYPIATTTVFKVNTDQTTVVQSAQETTPLEIIVGSNQTLGDISMQYLGNFDQHRLRQIQALNPGLIDPHDVQAGQRILLPGRVVEARMPLAKVRNLP
jgi:hypothetical protein